MIHVYTQKTVVTAQGRKGEGRREGGRKGREGGREGGGREGGRAPETEGPEQNTGAQFSMNFLRATGNEVLQTARDTKGPKCAPKVNAVRTAVQGVRLSDEH